MDLKELLSIKSSKIAKILFIISSTLIPGILIIYHFKNNDFNNLNTINLIALAFAITTPIFMANMILSALQKDIWDLGDKEERISFMFLYGGIITSTTVYIAFLVCYILKLNFRHFLTLMFLNEILYVLIIIYLCYKEKHKEEKNISPAITTPEE